MKTNKIAGLNKSLQKTLSFIMDNDMNKFELNIDQVKKFIEIVAELQSEAAAYNKHLLYVLINEADPAFRIKQEVLEGPAFAGMVRESEVLYPQDAPKPADLTSPRSRNY